MSEIIGQLPFYHNRTKKQGSSSAFSHSIALKCYLGNASRQEAYHKPVHFHWLIILRLHCRHAVLREKHALQKTVSLVLFHSVE